MINKEGENIDDETINKLGLRLTDKDVIALNQCSARVFEYPHLENVFIMEADIYGNPMPKDSCFLAFYGEHGLMGEPLEIQKLKNSKLEDIIKIVQRDKEG